MARLDAGRNTSCSLIEVFYHIQVCLLEWGSSLHLGNQRRLWIPPSSFPAGWAPLWRIPRTIFRFHIISFWSESSRIRGRDSGLWAEVLLMLWSSLRSKRQTPFLSRRPQLLKAHRSKSLNRSLWPKRASPNMALSSTKRNLQEFMPRDVGDRKAASFSWSTISRSIFFSLYFRMLRHNRKMLSMAILTSYAPVIRKEVLQTWAA